jgi:hypothetical protein
MTRRFLCVLAVLSATLIAAAPASLQAQNKFVWKPGIMIPVGLGVNGGIGTWGARTGLIVGKVTKPADDEILRAIGVVVLAEAATNEYSAVGIGVALAGGFALGPFVPMSVAGARLTINRARYNPYRNNDQRTATGVSLGFTYPLLNYGITLYREHEQAGYAADWQWRLSFGIGF